MVMGAIRVWIMPYAQGVAAEIPASQGGRRSACRGDLRVAATLPDAREQNLNDPIVNSYFQLEATPTQSISGLAKESRIKVSV